MRRGLGFTTALIALSLLTGAAGAQEFAQETAPDADEAQPRREIKPPNRERSNQKALRAFIDTVKKTSTVEEEDPFAALKAMESAAGATQPAPTPDSEGEGGVPEVGDGGETAAPSLSPEEMAGLSAQIHAQIQACWTLPPDVPNPRDLVVLVKARFNIDGSLDNAEVVDQLRFDNDPTFRSLAESAVKAVETCTPLNLPRTRYENWKLTLLTFDPASLLKR